MTLKLIVLIIAGVILIAGILVAIVLLSLFRDLAGKGRSARRNKNALVADLKKLGGEASDYPAIVTTPRVTLKGNVLTSAALQLAKELNYPILQLSGAKLNHKEWEELSGFTDLEELWLDNTNVASTSSST